MSLLFGLCGGLIAILIAAGIVAVYRTFQPIDDAMADLRAQAAMLSEQVEAAEAVAERLRRRREALILQKAEAVETLEKRSY